MIDSGEIREGIYHGELGLDGTMKGSQAHTLTPPPPRWSGQNIEDHIWPKVPEKNCHRVGGKFSFLPPVCIFQVFRRYGESWGIFRCVPNVKKKKDLRPPPSSVPNLATGPDPPGGYDFFQKPHVSVFRMISMTRGSF